MLSVHLLVAAGEAAAVIGLHHQAEHPERGGNSQPILQVWSGKAGQAAACLGAAPLFMFRLKSHSNCDQSLFKLDREGCFILIVPTEFRGRAELCLDAVCVYSH